MNDDAAVHPPGFLADPTRFLFFTGKGGVGKTSVACENYAQSTTKLPAAPTNIRATMMTPNGYADASPGHVPLARPRSTQRTESQFRLCR